MAITAFKVIQGHRKPVCDFLLVINSNLHPIGRTNGQTAFSSLDRVCIPCSAVKTSVNIDKRVSI